MNRMFQPALSSLKPVTHHEITIAGVRTFYREAGPAEAPVVLLPHGYPCSSYEFRHYMSALADRWRLLAPDFPGSGLSATPDDFRYDFDGFTDFLEDFLAATGVGRFAIYLHDFGSQIGLRLAMRRPQRVAGLILQNGDIYRDTLGPRYAPLLALFEDPTLQRRAAVWDAISEQGYEDEFLNGLSPDVAARIAPELWRWHWALTTDTRRRIAYRIIEGLKDNLAWFPRYQQYLHDAQPPTLIVWGPRDGYMPEASARAYLRDLPQAQLHLIDDGAHWLLETHLAEVVSLSRDFLDALGDWRTG